MKGAILKGRPLVWLIHNWFRLNPDMIGRQTVESNTIELTH